MTRLYQVRAPITGWIEMMVEAETEEAAVTLAGETFSIENVTEWEEHLDRAEVTDETWEPGEYEAMVAEIAARNTR